MGASLAKDVPFAALYWSMLEPLRGWLMLHDYEVHPLLLLSACLGLGLSICLKHLSQASPPDCVSLSITIPSTSGWTPSCVPVVRAAPHSHVQVAANLAHAPQAC